MKVTWPYNISRERNRDGYIVSKQLSLQLCCYYCPLKTVGGQTPEHSSHSGHADLLPDWTQNEKAYVTRSIAGQISIQKGGFL